MQPNQIKGASMEPSFYSGEYILTSKITYRFRSPHRGDVIVFKSPKNPDIDYIKRIMGLPGDQVMVKNSDLYINGQLLQENYTSAKINLWEGGFLRDGVPATIPRNEIFVMGDNRPRSSDSREFGPVPLDSIIGQVFFRYFPANKMGQVKNPVPQGFQSLLPSFQVLHQLTYFSARVF